MAWKNLISLDKIWMVESNAWLKKMKKTLAVHFQVSSLFEIEFKLIIIRNFIYLLITYRYIPYHM